MTNLLTVDGVTKSFGGLQALSGCSLSVEKGSIAGLIGPNGSGKTTLFNVITGYVKPDAGTVTFEGRNITAARPKPSLYPRGRTHISNHANIPENHRA